LGVTDAVQIDLSNRTAIVVGGAGGGIGTAVAIRLAAAGADVVALSNVAEQASDTAREVEALGRRALALTVDVTNDDELVGAIGTADDQLGPVRHLVNVVGGALPDDWHRAAEMDMEAFDRVTGRNLRYAMIAMREVGRSLIDAGLSGSMVNISSVAAHAAPLLAPYGASKAALESLTRTLALEWGRSGIRLNAVACGSIKTPRAGGADLDDFSSRIAAQRRGTPDDVAAATLFLLSDQADYITGETLRVDGGAGLGDASAAGRPPAAVTNPAVLDRFE
jgi:3-oxoacyl-[acyl-carrier protein] reductase